MVKATGPKDPVDASHVGNAPMARDFDRQVTELQIRCAVLNGYTALGIPVTVAVGLPGEKGNAPVT